MGLPVDHEAATGAVADVALFRAPKRGHTLAECEDAVAASSAATWPLHAAVADGATEAAFARRWAHLLVDGWVDAAPINPPEFAQAVAAWRRQWKQDVAGRVQDQPWYAAAKAEQGAFAALLGLTVQASGTWQAAGIGDCGLFQLRGATVRTAWPFTDPAAFTQRPTLLASRSGPSDRGPEVTQGTWAAGDTFVLASDALAAWLLRVGPTAARAVAADSFAEAVRAARTDGALRNDDVALVRITVHAT
jgi:hypothetical protein